MALPFLACHRSDDYEKDTLIPVRLVSILIDDDSNNGTDELIALAEGKYNILPDKMQSIIDSSFEKAKDLARMLI